MEDYARTKSAAPEVPGYDVGRCLGSGGSATVWLVTERQGGSEYALKCFPAGDGPDRGDAEEAIRREVRILSVLDHEHLIRAHSVYRLSGGHVRPSGDDNGDRGETVGLMMDYAAGGSVGQLVAGRGTLGPGETVTVLTPIAQALAYLHGQGFTHGDVSPGNVLFTAHGKPLLADLGVARMVADAAGSPTPAPRASGIPRRWTPSGQDCNRSVMCIHSRRWAGIASPDALPSRARSGRPCRCWFLESRRIWPLRWNPGFMRTAGCGPLPLSWRLPFIAVWRPYPWISRFPSTRRSSRNC